ncbi:MAG: DUF983 domain-containing protein [Acidimicrobiales bacterium]
MTSDPLDPGASGVEPVTQGPFRSDSPEVSSRRLIWRGLRKRCARCGAKGLFVGYLKMREICPGCGYRFERAEAFFLGAYTLNLAVTEILVFGLTVVPAIVVLAANPDADVWPMLVGGIGAAVVAPFAFYPHSKTLWSAIDMVMSRPDTRPPKHRDPSHQPNGRPGKGR